MPTNDIDLKRQENLRYYFRGGIPRLWCPLLAHYRDDGSLDIERMEAHFKFVSARVKGFLVPGSTGDGWELNDRETREFVEFALKAVKGTGSLLLLGVLRKYVSTMMTLIEQMIAGLAGKGNGDARRALSEANVCGFTVCPPGGELSRGEIRTGVADILELGLPTALYQLPQVVQNEVDPETFAELAARFPNLILFKDSSGEDRIAKSPVDKGGVFLVRGAEGDYSSWIKKAGGPYDGFLLSTCNCFPGLLSDMIDKLDAGDRQGAGGISQRLTGAVLEVFTLVQSLPGGNAFTNANKAMDHYFAFGPSAGSKQAPMLHCGIRITGHMISRTGEILQKYNLMPSRGYAQ
jgi:dihydrodipicolinate synthase/N-acetylneuraminate lyase